MDHVPRRHRTESDEQKDVSRSIIVDFALAYDEVEKLLLDELSNCGIC